MIIPPGLGSMDRSPNYRCPACGADVVLPHYITAGDTDHDPARLARLARAACGCWTSNINDEGTVRLLEAMMGGESADELPA